MELCQICEWYTIEETEVYCRYALICLMAGCSLFQEKEKEKE